MNMAKKKATKKKVTKKSEPQEDLNAGKEKGDQLDLIDITPDEAKEILASVKRYKIHQSDRLAAGKRETEEKEHVLELVKKADLQRLKDGKIKFNYGGFTVSVTPQSDLIQIKEEEIKPPKDKSEE